LSDRSEHTFYFFFWVDAGDAVISLVQLQAGVGSSQNSINTIDGSTKPCLGIKHVGLFDVVLRHSKLGSGTPIAYITPGNSAWTTSICYASSTSTIHTGLVLGDSISRAPYGINLSIILVGSVATDLNYPYTVLAVLKGLE